MGVGQSDGNQVVVKRNRFLAKTPKPKQGSQEKPKFRPKPKFRQKHFFRPKQSILAETASFGRNVLFRPEQNMVLHHIFCQNRGLNMVFLAKKDYTLFRP